MSAEKFLCGGATPASERLAGGRAGREERAVRPANSPPMRLPAVQYWTSACFVCGRDNLEGMRATVVAGKWGAVVAATLPEKLVGLPGILHGGVVVAVLDEAMWYAVYGQAGIPSVTAHLDARFVRPAPPGRPLLAVARLERRDEAEAPAEEGRAPRRRIGRAVARLVDGEGRLIAAARGRFCEMTAEGSVHRLLHSGPVEARALEDLVRWPGVEAFLKGGGY